MIGLLEIYQHVHIHMCDSTDQGEVWPLLEADVDGIIFVYDTSDLERVQAAHLLLAKTLSKDHSKGPRILILANKQDLSKAIQPTRAKSYGTSRCSATCSMGSNS